MQDFYFLLNADNKVSDGFTLEQLADFKLTAKQLVNKNSVEWKEASQYPELHKYLQNETLSFHTSVNKPLPPIAPVNIEEKVIVQPANNTKANSLFNELALKYKNLSQKQRQYSIYGIALMVLLFGIYHWNNSNCVADLNTLEDSLLNMNAELTEKRRQLSAFESEVNEAQTQLRYAKRAIYEYPLRTPAKRTYDIETAQNRLTQRIQRRDECREEIEETNTQINILIRDIDKLQRKCGED